MIESITFWAYLAGFIDGDGTVQMNKGSGYITPAISIAQSGENGRVLLEEIKYKLAQHGINSCVLRCPGNETRLSKLPAYVLSVHRVKNVVPLLRKIIPFIRLKRVVAQDILRFLTMYPSLRSGRVGSMLGRERAKRYNLLNNFHGKTPWQIKTSN